jgi:hypothetical protein
VLQPRRMECPALRTPMVSQAAMVQRIGPALPRHIWRTSHCHGFPVRPKCWCSTTGLSISKPARAGHRAFSRGGRSVGSVRPEGPSPSPEPRGSGGQEDVQTSTLTLPSAPEPAEVTRESG